MEVQKSLLCSLLVLKRSLVTTRLPAFPSTLYTTAAVLSIGAYMMLDLRANCGAHLVTPVVPEQSRYPQELCASGACVMRPRCGGLLAAQQVLRSFLRDLLRTCCELDIDFLRGV